MMKNVIAMCVAASAVLMSTAHAQAPAEAPLQSQSQSPSPAAGQAPVSEAHLAAVRDMLESLRIIDLTIMGIKLRKPKDTNEAEFFAYFLKHLKKEELTDRYVAVYARHVSTADARSLAAGFRKPAARKVLQYQIDSRTLGKDRAAPLNAADTKAMRAFEFSSDGFKFLDLQKRAGPDAGAALGKLVGEFHGNLFTSGFQALARHNAARAQAEVQTEPVMFLPEKIGISYVDSVMRLIATSAFRNTHATWRVDHEIDALGMTEMMTPPSLVSAEQRPKSRAALDQIEQKVEGFLVEVDANLAQFIESFKSVSMPGKQEFQRGFQIGLERHVNWSVRFAENQRAMLDVMRRILTFVEARQGQVEAKDDKMVFRTDADVELYNALVEEMRREVAKSDTLRGEAIGRMTRAAQGKL